MGLPSKLKNCILFNDGVSLAGETGEIKLPKLGRQMEEWRGGGMNAPVKLDLGMQGLELEWEVGGLLKQAIRQFGLPTFDGAQLRFVGAYQNDETGSADSVEVTIRGRHEEIDMGSQKGGEDTKTNVKTACAYYKLTINGYVEMEIDIINMIEIVDGVDRLADQRRALGV